MKSRPAGVGGRILLTVGMIVIFWMYRICLIYAVGYAAAMPFPGWWLHAFTRSAHGIFLWVFLWHTLATIMVSLPFAWVLARFYGRLGVYLGVAAALVLVIPDIFSLARYYYLISRFGLTFDIVDSIKMLVVLPFAVWLFQRLSPNSPLGVPRWAGQSANHRPRADTTDCQVRFNTTEDDALNS